MCVFYHGIIFDVFVFSGPATYFVIDFFDWLRKHLEADGHRDYGGFVCLFLYVDYVGFFDLWHFFGWTVHVLLDYFFDDRYFYFYFFYRSAVPPGGGD